MIEEIVAEEPPFPDGFLDTGALLAESRLPAVPKKTLSLENMGTGIKVNGAFISGRDCPELLEFLIRRESGGG